ncbi:MAG: hypothetical protein FWD86_02505 [Firmicutes bacterium]|nr:hypothetical protein [Bacillota bacterium]
MDKREKKLLGDQLVEVCKKEILQTYFDQSAVFAQQSDLPKNGETKSSADDGAADKNTNDTCDCTCDCSAENTDKNTLSENEDAYGFESSQKNFFLKADNFSQKISNTKPAQIGQNADTAQNILKEAAHLLNLGADPNHARSRPMFFAVKNRNFDLIRLLIDHNALSMPLSKNYLSALCERGGFDDQTAFKFFELIDYSIKKTGFCKDYITPFINTMLLAGRPSKVVETAKKYSVNLSSLIAQIPSFVVIEILEQEHHNSFDLILQHHDCLQQTIDAAVSGGRERAVNYIFENFDPMDFEISDEALLKAAIGNNIYLLKLLCENGINLCKEGVFIAAARVFSFRDRPLRFLMDTYKSNITTDLILTLKKIALKENDTALIDYLDKNFS